MKLLMLIVAWKTILLAVRLYCCFESPVMVMEPNELIASCYIGSRSDLHYEHLWAKSVFNIYF